MSTHLFSVFIVYIVWHFSVVKKEKTKNCEIEKKVDTFCIIVMHYEIAK